MLYAIFTFAGLLGGFFLFYAVYRGELKRKRERKKPLFYKLIIVIVMGHGMLLSTASYILAAYGKETVSDVSTVLITEIIAPMLTYAVTRTIENLHEKNVLKNSTPADIYLKQIKAGEL